MLAAIRAFFSTSARQAMGWSFVGILGVGFAGAGALFILDSGNSGRPATAIPVRTVTATPSETAIPRTNAATTPVDTATGIPTRVGLTATAFAAQQADQTATTHPRTLSPAASSTATRIPTSTPTHPGGDEDEPAETPPVATPTAEPTAIEAPPTPTEPAVFAYCDGDGGGGTPPSAIFGIVTIGGVAAPPGTAVTLAFDGVPALSTSVSVDGDAAGYRFLYSVGGAGCSNQPGASMSVIVDGTAYAAPVSAGGGVATLFNVGN